MKIYKLSDDLTNKHKCDTLEVETSDDAVVSYVITDLRQGVRNLDWVNIYVNEKYAFSLDIAQVVDLGVKKGLVISEEQLEEFKKASEFGKLYQRALEWVLVRPRSEREVRDYLYRKLKTSSSETLPRARLHGAQSLLERPAGRSNSSEDVYEFSSRIIEKLKDKKYLDDRRFAEYYVENRFVKKGVSTKRLKMELVKKGVSKEIIEEVLAESDRDEKSEILKMIAKKRAKYDDEKLIAYLCRQGFGYDLVRETVSEYGKD